MKIYGKSDDLIYLEDKNGEIIVEYCDPSMYNRTTIITISDGTQLVVNYTNGLWQIKPRHKGDLYCCTIKAVGNDGKHIGDANELPPYSCVVFLSNIPNWIIIGFKKYKLSNNGSK